MCDLVIDDNDNKLLVENEIQTPFEQTELYCLIGRASRVSLRLAWKLMATVDDIGIQTRSTIDRSTYLHHLINQVRSDVKLTC